MKNKKIKVLQLGNAGDLYGAERWILALIKHLDATKIESWAASIRDELSLKASLCFEAKKLKLRVKLFDCYGKFNFSSVKQLRKFILEKEINIIHTHHYKTDIIGLLATKGTSCKIVSTPHGWTNKPDFKLRIYEIINRIIFPFFDAVVPLSQELYTPLARIPGLKKKLNLITNGVDTSEIEAIGHITDEILSLKKDNAFIIGYIGRLTPGKGLDILLNAVAEYGEPNWHVVIVGEGEQYLELKSMVKVLEIVKRVHFFGFRPDRLLFMKGFDVFVLPSKSEGTPRCLMEAMAVGVPVIASDIPGCRNLIDGKTTGLLFQPENPKDLADLLVKISSDTELNNSLCKNGKQFVNNNFSAAVMAKKYEALFLALLHNTPYKNV